MMELPSLQALDQAQASRIWLAVEPTDMRCVSEREMKRVVLNRKNSLFVGNPRGGRTAAILANPNQHLPAARGRSPVVSHTAADEPAPGENERVVRLAAGPMEASSRRSHGSPEHFPSRALVTQITCGLLIAHRPSEEKDFSSKTVSRTGSIEV